MNEKELTFDGLKAALKLYTSLPAATLFRSQTGFGLVVDKHDHEVIGYIPNANGIWKPMYLVVTGGSQKGRTTLTAEQVTQAVELFKANPLWAILRSTTGIGLQLNNGQVELVDSRKADTEVTFDITHYGGRAITPELVTELGLVDLPEIDWRGGFVYEQPGNRPVAQGQSLILNRLLLDSEYADEDALKAVLDELAAEANKLTLTVTNGRLPRNTTRSSGNVRVVLSQELTRLVPGLQIDRQRGFSYNDGGTVVVEMTLSGRNVNGEVAFYETLEAFKEECSRVLTLYCQPLSETQRQKLARPSDPTSDTLEIAKITFQRDERRSTAQNEQLIARRSNTRAPHFPFTGWTPERDKTYWVILHKWGNGMRVSPAPATQVERLAQVDDATYARQVVRINYDGRERVVSEATFTFEEKEDFIDSTSWSAELVRDASGDWWAVQTCKPFFKRQREYVHGGKLSWKVVETQETPFCRRISPNRVWIEPRPSSSVRTEDWEMLNPAEARYGWVVKASFTTPEGDEQTVTYKFSRVREGYSDITEWKWDDLPHDLQVAYSEAAWPVCACERARYDASKYDTCRLCRQYVNCTRCGKQQAYAGEERVAAGATTCSNCATYYEAREMWIGKHITPDLLARIRQQAEAFAQAPQLCRWWEGVEDSGVLYVLENGCYGTQFHPEGQQRLIAMPDSGNELVTCIQAILHGFLNAGAPSFNEQAVIGLARRLMDGMVVIGEYAMMRPDQYVELWQQAESLRPLYEAVTDYDTRSEYGIDNNFAYKLSLSFDVTDQYEVVAAKIAETEARLRVAEFYHTHRELGREHRALAPIVALLKNVEAAFVEEGPKAIAQAEQALTDRQKSVEDGTIWPDVQIPISTESRTSTHVWCIAPDGSIIDPISKDLGYKNRVNAYRYGDLPTTHLVISHENDDYGYRYTERWEVHHLSTEVTDEQRVTVERLLAESRRYFIGPNWDLTQVGSITYTTEYSRDMVGEDRQAHNEQISSFPIDVCEYESWDGEAPNTIVIGPHKHRSPEQKQLNELATLLADLTTQLHGEEMSLGYEREMHEQALEAAVARLEENWSTKPLEAGDVFEVIFRTEERNGELQLVAGPLYDDPSASWIKFIVDPFQEIVPQTGRPVLVRVRAKNSQQTHLFAYRADNPEGKHGRGGRQITVYGYFVQPIPDEAYGLSEIKAIKAQIATVEKEIAQVRASLAAGTSSSEPPTAMAAAFRRAQAKNRKQ